MLPLDSLLPQCNLVHTISHFLLRTMEGEHPEISKSDGYNGRGYYSRVSTATPSSRAEARAGINIERLLRRGGKTSERRN